MNTAYTSVDDILAQVATTPEEFRRKQELVEYYGGGIEVVDPNSPISAQEFAEAAMYVFEEHGHFAEVIAEIDNAMNIAAEDLPSLNEFTVGIQHEDVFSGYVAFGKDDYAQALYSYMTSPFGEAFHIVDVRHTAQRYNEPGFASGLKRIFGMMNDDYPEDVKQANEEIARLFALELGRALFDYYSIERGFGVELKSDVGFLSNWLGSNLDLQRPFAVAFVLRW